MRARIVAAKMADCSLNSMQGILSWSVSSRHSINSCFYETGSVVTVFGTPLLVPVMNCVHPGRVKYLCELPKPQNVMPQQCSCTDHVLDSSSYGCFTGDFWTAEAMSDVADFTIMRKHNWVSVNCCERKKAF